MERLRLEINRMEIYAGLRVPEVWRCDGQKVTMWQLRPDNQYQPCETSLSFPGLRPADVERFLELGRTTPKREWARQLREWVRSELIPRRKVEGQQQKPGGATEPGPAV